MHMQHVTADLCRLPPAPHKVQRVRAENTETANEKTRH